MSDDLRVGEPEISRRAAALTETVSYLEGGSGHDLVFLHSVGAGADLWRPQLLEFGRDHHVLAPDLRGHGETTWATGLSPGQMAFDVEALLDHLQAGPAVAVGLSMGANVALELAVIAPRLVRGLVLASAFTNPPPELQRVLRGFADEAEKIINMDDHARRRAERMLRPGAEGAGDFFVGARRMSKAAMVKLGRALSEWNVTPMLHGISVPCLLLRGEADPYLDADLTEQIAAQLPDARVAVLPGAGHLSNVDAPEAFNQAVREFVEEVESHQATS